MAQSLSVIFDYRNGDFIQFLAKKFVRLAAMQIGGTDIYLSGQFVNFIDLR